MVMLIGCDNVFIEIILNERQDVLTHRTQKFF